MPEENGEVPDSRDSGGDQTNRVVSELSRRDFSRAIGSAAGALTVGASTTGTATAGVTDERCGSSDTLAVGDGQCRLINNQWSTTAVQQCVKRYDDGSYGWDWERGSTGAGGPNYPEVLIGTKPWGSDTGSSLFPIQRGDVDQFELALDIEQSASGGEWNLAEEWWLTTSQPGGDVSDSIAHEVMLVLDWGPDHGHGGVIDAGAVTDSYGNTIDYWANYRIGWNFHIFRIADGTVPAAVDLTAISEYLSATVDSISPDLWLSGVELGSEYWDDTAGSITIQQFDVTLNGQTAASGATGGTDTTAPTAPTNLTSPAQTASTVDLDWDGASDTGGSGLAGYTLSVDGTQVKQVGANTTTATIDGLSAGTSYEFAVVAVDGAGNSSSGATLSQSTRPEQQPYDGPHTVPGRLQAEAFDLGGEGVAYHDTTAGNTGGNYRETNVDIGTTNGGYCLGWIEAGEWWEYTVAVEADGTYGLTARIASATGGGRFHVEVDGETVGQLSFGATGGWNAWETVSTSGIDLTSGEHVVRVVADADGWNLDWIDLYAPTGSESLLVTDYATYPNGNALGNWSDANSFQNSGVVDGALRLDYDGAGWYGERIGQDVSAYEYLVFRIKGASGGEETDFTVELGGSTRLLAEASADTITTSFGEVWIDLEAIGVDRTEPGQLNCNFWQGQSGTVTIDEIRFE